MIADYIIALLSTPPYIAFAPRNKAIIDRQVLDCTHTNLKCPRLLSLPAMAEGTVAHSCFTGFRLPEDVTSTHYRKDTGSSISVAAPGTVSQGVTAAIYRCARPGKTNVGRATRALDIVLHRIIFHVGIPRPSPWQFAISSISRRQTSCRATLGGADNKQSASFPTP